jgi:probable HAF family extracellular repeat protein
VRTKRAIVVLAVSACALVAGTTAANATAASAAGDVRAWRVVDLGLGDDSSAAAINNRGHVVGSSAAGGFLWRRGRVTYLGHLPGHLTSRPADVNNHDEVVGSSVAADGTSHAFLWRRGVMTDLGVLPGGDNSYAMAINDRGEIVGFSANAADNMELRAVRWHHGRMTVLETPFHHSIANDINNSGVIVGNATIGQSIESGAVRWRHNRIQGLTAGLPGTATAVSERGDITGLVFGGQTHGFLWQGGRTIALPRLKGASEASGINDRGQIVGYSTVKPDGTNAHAVLWVPLTGRGPAYSLATPLDQRSIGMAAGALVRTPVADVTGADSEPVSNGHDDGPSEDL